MSIMCMKSSLRALPLLVAVAFLLVGASYRPIPRSFHVVVSDATWAEAQTYCREKYTDLATILNHEDQDNIPECGTSDHRCHIGLHRDLGQPENWVWPWGDKASYSKWASDDEKNQMTDDCCVVLNNKKWYSVHYDNLLNFICQDVKLFLVRENKTWEEALDHCRALQANLSLDYNTQNALYDLPSLQNASDLYYARRMIQSATTEQVWTSLRYLGNRWLWVNGDDQKYQDLPSCPMEGRYCGTLSKQGGDWNISDCQERKNFLCYQLSP